MSTEGYPFGDALVPDRFDQHTVIFLVRPHDAPSFTEEELDRLQADHLTYLRDLQRKGVLVANGPLDEQTDARLRGISVYGCRFAMRSSWRGRIRWSAPDGSRSMERDG